MSWTKSMMKLSIAAVALASGGIALASTLVVRSNGPSAGSYPPGKALAAGTTITLKAGDTVTVLDASGTRVLKGPGAIPVSGSKTASANGISALIADNGARQSRTGATRGAVGGGTPHASNVWIVDASRSGTICLLDPQTVSLWRPADGDAGTLKLTRLADGKSANIDFRAGQAVRTWPVAEVPVTEGASYRLEGLGMAKPVTVKATLLTQAPDSLDATAQVLLHKGCSAQVDMLVAATTIEATD